MYVGDEIVTAASNVRIRVNNTDAEGRFAMGDCLYYMKEEVRDSEAGIKCVLKNSIIFFVFIV
jgi:hypothetical protein